MTKLYWMSDAEWACLEPLLPRGRRGAHRVDDRHGVSGIIHALNSGAHGRDCPSAYRPIITVYTRFNRWRRPRLWLAMFEAVTGLSGLYRDSHLDSAPIKARRSARGGQGRRPTSNRLSRGEQSSTLHRVTNGLDRPRTLAISRGSTNDIQIAAIGSIEPDPNRLFFLPLRCAHLSKRSHRRPRALSSSPAGPPTTRPCGPTQNQ
jgi:transposase